MHNFAMNTLISIAKFYFMRRFYFFIAALFITATVTAQESAPVLRAKSPAAAKMLKKRADTRAAAQRIAGVEEITETPAGRLIDNMSLSAFSLYPRSFEIFQRMASGKVSAIVEGEDGALYVKNPVGVYPTDSWLKLEHREGTTYVARLPQTATEPWEYEGETIRMNFDRLDFDEDEGYYYPSFSQSELTFNYEDGILTSVGELGEDTDVPVMLGITYDIYGPEDRDEAWAWFGSNNITVRPMTETPGALPAGVEASRKIMVTAKGDTRAWVAFDGNDVYLKPAEKLGFARGTLADGKVTFENDQYLGISGGSHCYLRGATGVFVEDEDYYEGGYTIYEPADNLVFDYMPENALLETDGALVLNEGDASFYAVDIFDKPSIHDYVSVNAAPMNPVIERVEPYDDWEEYGVVVFSLPTTSVDGDEISKVDLHYNIFVKGNDEPYTFKADMYELLNSDMVDVPYSFTDGGYDFSVSDTRHTVVIYEDLGTIGIQSVNTAADKVYKSDIVWSDGSQSGIDSVIVDEDGENILYDLWGRRVNDPQPGIYISRQGKKATKVVIK